MKLKVGKAEYGFRKTGDGPVALVIRGRNGKDLALKTVPPEVMASMQAQLGAFRGIPALVAYDAKKERLIFHPVPAAEYEIDASRELVGKAA
jgi:hypothetical protein